MNKENLAIQPSYISPFARIDFDEAGSYQSFDGTLSQVMRELKFNLSLDTAKKAQIVHALHPPRITRAIIDYFVNDPSLDYSMKTPLIQKSISFGLDLYERRVSMQALSKKVEDLEREIALSHPDLLNCNLVQVKDKTTWDATNPGLSKKTAERLTDVIKSEDILFISLAHGSIAPGMDVFLQFFNLRGKLNYKKSTFYPVRLSTKKKRDRTPRVSDQEQEFLKIEAGNKQVILFDEDRITGNTLEIASEFFRTLLVNVQYPVIKETNLTIQCELGEN